jgi:hypothetical protein
MAKKLIPKALLAELAPLPEWADKFPRGKGGSRWLRITELPFSRGYAYNLISQGFLFSVEFRIPGSKRSIRLVDAESLDKYLLSLGRKQQMAKTKAAEVAVK